MAKRQKQQENRDESKSPEKKQIPRNRNSKIEIEKKNDPKGIKNNSTLMRTKSIVKQSNKDN